MTIQPMTWFGPTWDAMICETAEQAETPVGLPCLHCDEPIAEGERGVLHDGRYVGSDYARYLTPEGRVAYHLECSMRLALGGANHIAGRCTCCGGHDPPDPPHLTKREAARLAVATWNRRRLDQGLGERWRR